MWIFVLIVFASLLALFIGMGSSAVIVAQALYESQDAWAEEDLDGVIQALSQGSRTTQEGEMPC